MAEERLVGALRQSQKNPRVRKIFLSAILGPEMAAPILWVPRISVFFLQENLHVHKIPCFRGGVFWVWFGGGSADFIFMGAGIFMTVCPPNRPHPFAHSRVLKEERKPPLVGERRFGRNLRDNLGKGNCKSRVASRQWGAKRPNRYSNPVALHSVAQRFLKNLSTPLFLMGCFPVDFQELNGPLGQRSGKRPIKVGKRPIKEGKHPIKAMVLVGISVCWLMGCFLAPRPWQKMAPLKRPIKGSMKHFQGFGGGSQENRATPPEKGPVAPAFAALKGGVTLQVAS